MTVLWMLAALVSVELTTRWAARRDWAGVVKGGLCAVGSFMMAAANVVAGALS